MISTQQLDEIGRFVLDGPPVSETTVTALRQRFSGLHFTYCLDDDVIDASPVYEQTGFNLYLVDSRNHCLCFTQDPGLATGIVLAEIA